MTPSVTQTELFTLVRAFLLSLNPCADFEVIKAQENRVNMPAASLFVQLTPRSRTPLSTTTETFVVDSNANGSTLFLGPTRINIQSDVFGETSSDFASVVATVFRTDWAASWFAAQNPAVQPLFATEGQQTPLTTSELQYKSRWTQELALQANLRMEANQDYMTEIEVGLINVDAAFPAQG